MAVHPQTHMHQYTFRWTLRDAMRAHRAMSRYVMGGVWLKVAHLKAGRRAAKKVTRVIEPLGGRTA